MIFPKANTVLALMALVSGGVEVYAGGLKGTSRRLRGSEVNDNKTCGSMSKKQADYRGTLAETKSGLKCQPWADQAPHKHDLTKENYPDAGLEENYCRNPDGETGAWCYTMSEEKRWEFCDVPACEEEPFTIIFISDMENDYRGNNREWCEKIAKYVKDFGDRNEKFDEYPDYKIDPKLVIHGGDLSDAKYYWDYSAESLFDSTYQQIYDANIPFISVGGNHDFDWGPESEEKYQRRKDKSKIAVEFVRKSFEKAADLTSDFTFDEIDTNDPTNSYYVANFRGLQIGTANYFFEGANDQWDKFKSKLDDSKQALFFSHVPLHYGENKGFEYADFIASFPNPQHFAGHTHNYQAPEDYRGVTTNIAPYPHPWNDAEPGFLALLVSPSKGVMETKKIDFNYAEVTECWPDDTVCMAGTSCRFCCHKARKAGGTRCGGDPWEDGTRCADGTTCNLCKNTATWWNMKGGWACGGEPSWDDGSICSLGTTCDLCAVKATYWYGKAATACGSEPCWDDGSVCAAGTTCNSCCNGYEYWNMKAFTACGSEPCWGPGTICGLGTTCNNCCNGAHWYSQCK